MSNTLVQHLSLSNEHYTPPELASECIRVCKLNYNGLVLDPASNALANTIIQADTYFTKKQDGLRQCWFGYKIVFCNPPGGKIAGKSVQSTWADKFCEEFRNFSFEVGAFICFNQSLAFRHRGLWESASCFLLPQRIKYFSEYTPGTLREGQWSPTRKPINFDIFKYQDGMYISHCGNYSIQDNRALEWTNSPPQGTCVFIKHRHPLTESAFQAFSAIKVGVIK